MFGISKMEPMVHTLLKSLEKKQNLEGVEAILYNCKQIIDRVKEELIAELKTLENE